MDTVATNPICPLMLRYQVCLELAARLSHSITVQRHCGDTIKNRAPGTMPAEKEREQRRLIPVQSRRPFSRRRIEEDPNHTT